jgi:hypothetical protein
VVADGPGVERDGEVGVKLRWLLASVTLTTVVVVIAPPAGAREAGPQYQSQTADWSCDAWYDWGWAPPWCWDWSWLTGGDAPATEAPDPADQPMPVPAEARLVRARFSAQLSDGRPVDVPIHVRTRQDLPFQQDDDNLDEDAVDAELVQGNQYTVSAPPTFEGRRVSHWLVDGQRIGDGQPEASFQAPFTDYATGAASVEADIIVVYE